MIVLLFFAFLSGLVTILAPCIWPLLPIVLSTSLNGGKAKSLGITLGILLTFGIFTIAISYLVALFGFDPGILRIFAVAILVALGIMMIVPPLARVFEGFVSRLAGKFGSTSQPGSFGSKHYFLGGFLTGASLGIVWTPCAGPILAAIATLSVTSQVNFGIILVTIAYLIGVGIPLFFFSYGGQKLVGNTRFLSKYTGRIQQAFGVLLLLTALAIGTNYDKVLQARILDALPSYSSFLTGFEKSSVVKEQLDILKGIRGSEEPKETNVQSELFNVTNKVEAPEFTGITKWLNPEIPLTMKDLRGKVVLVDFWTYTCINCIRTLPYVTSWYDKYKDKGFVVVGVHTPEFEFEKNTQNVLDAVKRFNVHYPVAQDNDYATWNAYQNRYWPAEYLIDAKGIVRRVHFGEGEYDQMEMAIQKLLGKKGSQVDQQIIELQDQTPAIRITPETYIGSSRRDRFASKEAVNGGVQTFTRSESLQENHFGFSGTWDVEDEMAKTVKNSVLEFDFLANKVFLVMTPAGQNDTVKIYLDGKLVDSSNAGADVQDGVVKLDTQRLYNLIDLKGKPGNHLLKLEFQIPGTSLYAFTFG